MATAAILATLRVRLECLTPEQQTKFALTDAVLADTPRDETMLFCALHAANRVPYGTLLQATEWLLGKRKPPKRTQALNGLLQLLRGDDALATGANIGEACYHLRKHAHIHCLHGQAYSSAFHSETLLSQCAMLERIRYMDTSCNALLQENEVLRADTQVAFASRLLEEHMSVREAFPSVHATEQEWMSFIFHAAYVLGDYILRDSGTEAQSFDEDIAIVSETRIGTPVPMLLSLFLRVADILAGMVDYEKVAIGNGILLFFNVFVVTDNWETVNAETSRPYVLHTHVPLIRRAFCIAHARQRERSRASERPQRKRSRVGVSPPL